MTTAFDIGDDVVVPPCGCGCGEPTAPIGEVADIALEINGRPGPWYRVNVLTSNGPKQVVFHERELTDGTEIEERRPTAVDFATPCTGCGVTLDDCTDRQINGDANLCCDSCSHPDFAPDPWDSPEAVAFLADIGEELERAIVGVTYQGKLRLVKPGLTAAWLNWRRR